MSRTALDRFLQSLKHELRMAPEVMASNVSWFLLFFLPAGCMFVIGALIAAAALHLGGFAK